MCIYPAYRRWGLGLLFVLVGTIAQAHGPRGGYGYRHGGWAMTHGLRPWCLVRLSEPVCIFPVHIPLCRHPRS